MSLLLHQKNLTAVEHLTLVEILVVIMLTVSTLTFSTMQAYSWWQERIFFNTVEHLRHEIQKARDVMFFFDKDVTLTLINAGDALEVSWSIFPYKDGDGLKKFLDEKRVFSKLNVQENSVLNYASRGSVLPAGKITCTSMQNSLTTDLTFNESMGRHAFTKEETPLPLPPPFPLCPLNNVPISS